MRIVSVNLILLPLTDVDHTLTPEFAHRLRNHAHQLVQIKVHAFNELRNPSLRHQNSFPFRK